MALIDCSVCGVATDETEVFRHAKRDYQPICIDCFDRGNRWH